MPVISLKVEINVDAKFFVWGGEGGLYFWGLRRGNDLYVYISTLFFTFMGTFFSLGFFSVGRGRVRGSNEKMALCSAHFASAFSPVWENCIFHKSYNNDTLIREISEKLEVKRLSICWFGNYSSVTYGGVKWDCGQWFPQWRSSAVPFWEDIWAHWSVCCGLYYTVSVTAVVFLNTSSASPGNLLFALGPMDVDEFFKFDEL